MYTSLEICLEDFEYACLTSEVQTSYFCTAESYRSKRICDCWNVLEYFTIVFLSLARFPPTTKRVLNSTL